jgi:peptidyl-prolyl cis-trans isomerase C
MLAAPLLLPSRMKRFFLAILAAAPLAAQQPAKPAANVVASINGEVITAEKLDQMYDRLSPEMRLQYVQNGGKVALLDNYIRKRLLIQEAVKTGFDKKPSVRAELEAARESALFDRYVRDVVARDIVTDAEMKKYYEQHVDQFTDPAMIKVRHIVIGTGNTGARPHSDQEAMEIAKAALTEVITTVPKSDNPAAVAPEAATRFADIARRYSEDKAASSGGDLGWLTQGQLEPELDKVAFSLRTGMASGIVKTAQGYDIIFVEGKRAAGTESFDEVKPRIRELLLAQHASDIVAAVDKLTSELGDKGNVAVYPKNIK